MRLSSFKNRSSIVYFLLFITISQIFGPVYTKDTSAFQIPLTEIKISGQNEKNGILYQVLFNFLDDRILILVQAIILFIAINLLSIVINEYLGNKTIQMVIKFFILLNPYFIDWSRTLLPDVINLSLSLIFFLILFSKLQIKFKDSSLIILALLIFGIRFATGICLLLLLLIKFARNLFLNNGSYLLSFFKLLISTILFMILFSVINNYSSQARIQQMYNEHRIAVFGKEDSSFQEFYYGNGMPKCDELVEIWQDQENSIDWGTFMQKGMMKVCPETYEFINSSKITHWTYLKSVSTYDYFFERNLKAMFPEVAPRTLEGSPRVLVRFYMGFLPLVLFLYLIIRFNWSFDYFKFLASFTVIVSYSIAATYIDGKEPARHVLPLSLIFWLLPLLSLKILGKK